ncbi:unnamed protein product [Allacma fusca]|uniref:Uncharacterized protein n=1 Tax=Allacma fusca TaxID=39272 RepID=A0A8J2JG29_9HEXA|nr:unnamed protein product [Allacma fusca]
MILLNDIFVSASILITEWNLWNAYQKRDFLHGTCQGCTLHMNLYFIIWWKDLSEVRFSVFIIFSNNPG